VITGEEVRHMYESQLIRVVSSPSFRGFGPVGYRRSDARILEDVSEELNEHGQIDARDITVSVLDGEVTLTGTVPDEPMSRLVVAATQRLRGVRSVHNLLAVYPPRD
jgi:osmotically-inducible protein OsmY